MITIIQADGVAERRQINAMRARAAEKNADIERAVQAILEDVGYMARVAFIMDRIFRRFGLSGKSFIPMLGGTG